MNLDQFVKKYGGTQLTDNAGNYKGECLSLAKRYGQEVQGVINADAVLNSGVNAARGLYENFDHNGLQSKYYDKIPVTQPRKKGDLVVWGDNLGKYGDVAIALDSGTKIFGQLGTPVFKPANIRNELRKPLGYLRRKEDIEMFTQEWEVKNAFYMARGRNANAGEIKSWMGRPISEFLSKGMDLAKDRENKYKALVTDNKKLKYQLEQAGDPTSNDEAVKKGLKQRILDAVNKVK